MVPLLIGTFAARALSLAIVRLSADLFRLLKRIALLDTLTIGGLFTIRLALGVELAGVPYSPWLMAFAGFFFFSLRPGEAAWRVDGGEGRTWRWRLARRGYEVDDWPLTLGFGAASGHGGAADHDPVHVTNDAVPSRSTTMALALCCACGAGRLAGADLAAVASPRC